MTGLSRRALLGAAAFGVFAGCARPGGEPATPDAPLAARLAVPLRAGERDAFLALFTDASRPAAAVLFDNWRLLRAVELSDEDADDPSVRLVRVRWRAGGESRSATHRVAFVSSTGGFDREVDADPTPGPVWARSAIGVHRDQDATLVAAVRVAEQVEPWLEAARAAAAHLATADLGPAADAWDGALVVALPGDAGTFARMADRGEGLAGTFAYTLATGVGDEPHIVLNPDFLDGWAAEDRLGVLVHEGVHAATSSMFSAAPLWVVEGFAEHVAAAVWPRQAAANADLVERAVAAGPPKALPGPPDFGVSGDALATAYALSEVAVAAMIARWGRPAALVWIADWDDPGRPSADELTAVYLSALGLR